MKILDLTHSGLYYNSMDIETIDATEEERANILEEMIRSKEIFSKYWDCLSDDEKIDFIKSDNIGQYHNLGKDDNTSFSNYFIVINELYLNKNNPLIGTFYLTIDVETYNEYELYKYIG